MRRLLVCFVVSGLVAGCSSSTGIQAGKVVVTPSKSVYAPGELVTARLSNGLSNGISFGGCSLRAERQVGSQWELVGPEGVPCTMSLLFLGAYSERTLQLYDDLSVAGVYRLRFEFAPSPQLSIGEVAHSASFTVVAPQ